MGTTIRKPKILECNCFNGGKFGSKYFRNKIICLCFCIANSGISHLVFDKKVT